jgi:Phytochelatin synthase
MLGSWLFVADAPAKTLPLPQNLISLNSEEGERLLLQSKARQSYWNLSIQFLTQKTQSFCGVASIVMVLNALGTPAPTTPQYDPYTVFTQDDFFNARTEKVLPQTVLAEKGMTLDQIGQLLGAYGVHAEVHHAADATLDEFRRSAMEHMSKQGQYVIVNYLRRSMGQERGGHISPLGAYDAATDRFLILDVARYKYPPVWVKAKELFEAMNTTDSDNRNRTRGYVLIRANP